MSKEAILAALFGSGHGRNLLQADTFVARLRQSLAKAGLTDAIVTVAGRGYAVMGGRGDPDVNHVLPLNDPALVVA